MSLRLCAIALSIIVAISGLAQELPEKSPFPEPTPMSGKQQDPVSENEPPASRPTVMRRELPVESQDITDGTNGTIFMSNPPVPYVTSGILLRANTASMPEIAAKLGTDTTSASFVVADSNNTVLFRSRAGDGRFAIGELNPQQALHVTKSQNAGAGIRVSNPSNGSEAYATIGFNETSSVKAAVNSIGSGYTSAVGGANALQIWNHANAPIVFGANNVDTMRVFGGSVSIGSSTAAGARFTIYENQFASRTGFSLTKETVVGANANDNDYGSYLRAHQAVALGFTNSGSVINLHGEALNSGAGTITEAYAQRLYAGVKAGASGTVTRAYGARIVVQAGGGNVGSGYGLYIDDIAAAQGYGVYQSGSNDMNYFSGAVGIGTAPGSAYKLHVAGDAHVAGKLTGTVIEATYQDVAEWVPATENMVPGTVVVLNPEATNEVMPSAKPYDTTVAGVVSAQPGIILGKGSADKEQIATTGRVKVRVDATMGPIRVGDLLVTSGKPGLAMRSEPMEIQGRSFHQPGTLIGKALEPLAAGEGEILVLLSLQ